MVGFIQIIEFPVHSDVLILHGASLIISGVTGWNRLKVERNSRKWTIFSTLSSEYRK